MSSDEANQLTAGGVLLSSTTVYAVKAILGQGAFGKVAKCRKMDDMTTVAVKVTSNQGSHGQQAEIEVDNLEKLSQLDSECCNIVKWHTAFIDRDYFCLEFEQLDKSLADFMMVRNYKPLQLRETRPIIQQIANALDHLKTVGMIHADLKPENVMMANHPELPYKIKVIDFGLACDVSAATVGAYIQTRHYRSPEIILGLGFSEAIDMWSLGCIAAYLHLGTTLYPGNCEYDMLRYIQDLQGQIPDSLLNQAKYVDWFFNGDDDPLNSNWILMDQEEYFLETGIQPMELRRLYLESLDQLLKIPPLTSEEGANKDVERIDRDMFVKMLKGMLEIDPHRRLTPREVLEHPFITMSQIDFMTKSSYVRSGKKLMEICQSRVSTDDFNAGGSTSNVADPSQQNLSTSRGPDDSEHTPSTDQPCTSQSTRKAGVKRRAHQEEETTESFHPSKRDKLEHSESASSHAANTPHRQVNKDAPQTSQTPSGSRAGLKRRLPSHEDGGQENTDSSANKKSRKDSVTSPAAPCSSCGQSSGSTAVKRKTPQEGFSEELVPPRKSARLN